MKLAVISFTKKGNQVNQVLTKRLKDMGELCTGYVMSRFFNGDEALNGVVPVTSLQEWAREQFSHVDGMIFVGAAGIAVRTIAPYVKDKLTDPAVVVMDEQTQFCISLLSGHVGGANELAQTVAGITGAVLVVTTATDVNGKFAVDVFARERGMVMGERSAAKLISADVLEGRPVGFYSDFPVEGKLPDGFSSEKLCERNVWITSREHGEEEMRFRVLTTPGNGVLRLIPKVLVAGVGCRRGTPAEIVMAAVSEALKEANRSREAIKVIASIDLKKEEPGLLQCVTDLGAEFYTFSAKSLKEVPGDYTDSAFVAGVTGVGNVCERAAMKAVLQEGGGCLILKKRAQNGVTVALAEKDWTVRM